MGIDRKNRMRAGVAGGGDLARDTQALLCAAGIPVMEVGPGTDLVFLAVDPWEVNGWVEGLRRDDPGIGIVIRATVVPGTCRSLGCAYMPAMGPCAGIFGIDPGIPGEQQIREAWSRMVPDHPGPVATDVAEVAKCARSCFLAAKISFFNEIATACDRLGIPFDDVRRAVVGDPRIGEGHTQVPGPDGQYGFGGAHLPADLRAFAGFLRAEGILSPLLDAIWMRNTMLDRAD